MLSFAEQMIFRDSYRTKMILRHVHKTNWQNENNSSLFKASLALNFLLLIELGFFVA